MFHVGQVQFLSLLNKRFQLLICLNPEIITSSPDMSPCFVIWRSRFQDLGCFILYKTVVTSDLLGYVPLVRVVDTLHRRLFIADRSEKNLKRDWSIALAFGSKTATNLLHHVFVRLPRVTVSRFFESSSGLVRSKLDAQIFLWGTSCSNKAPLLLLVRHL